MAKWIAEFPANKEDELAHLEDRVIKRIQETMRSGGIKEFSEKKSTPPKPPENRTV